MTIQILFRCPRPLNRGIRLIKVSYKVNKGNKFGDFGYCPLNRGYLLNTVSAQYRFRQKMLPESPFLFPSLISGFAEGLTDSVIVGDNVHHLANLSTWLKPVAQSESSKWKRCWLASVDGWAASTFHSGCDNKGPTVTIIRVGGTYIFGGYTKLSWGK